MRHPRCLEPNTIAELVCGSLQAERLRRALEHVDHCEDCRRVAAIAVLGRSGRGETPFLRPGDWFAGYRILETIGAGAMGVVYGAIDEKLHRTIALKLVRESDRPAEGVPAQVRLMCEAKAAAALNHPNVVVIHEVGESEGRAFIAMELVGGGTLRDWLDACPRTPDEVLAMFLQAGAGLAAAHDAGVIHRDFKPDNVLVGHDGRPRVADFGVARQADVPLSEGAIRTVFGNAVATEAGTVVGTLAYMAPEQLTGGKADARSDQFSFAVSLYEGLYGARPVRTRLDGAKSLLPPSRGRSGDRVPVRVRRALLRGMGSDPRDRFPDMRAFMAALSGAARVTPAGAILRLAWFAGGVAGVVAAAAAAMLIARSASHAVSLVRSTQWATAATPIMGDDPPDLVLLLDASHVKTAADGTVTAWTDDSGSGNDAVPRGRHPMWVPNAIHGLPAIHFEGGSYLAIEDSPSLRLGRGDFAIAIVARHDRQSARDLGLAYTRTTGYGLLYAKTEVPDPFTGLGLFVNYPQPTPSTRLGAQTNYRRYVLSATEELNDGRAHVFGARRMAGLLEVRVDGRAEAAVAGAYDDLTARGRPAFIGAHPQDDGVIQQLKGDIAEIVLRRGPTSTTSLAAIESNLAAKYGIVLGAAIGRD
jgi:hypothetical protein